MIVAAVSIATVINFIILGGALHKLKHQANDGSQAKARQCLLYPVSEKLYVGAERYHIITHHDLTTFLDNSPTNCP